MASVAPSFSMRAISDSIETLRVSAMCLTAASYSSSATSTFSFSAMASSIMSSLTFLTASP